MHLTLFSWDACFVFALVIVIVFVHVNVNVIVIVITPQSRDMYVERCMGGPLYQPLLRDMDVQRMP